MKKKMKISFQELKRKVKKLKKEANRCANNDHELNLESGNGVNASEAYEAITVIDGWVDATEGDADKLQKKVERLESVLEDALSILVDIRYREWEIPGMGVDLTEEKLDQVIIEAERILPKLKE